MIVCVIHSFWGFVWCRRLITVLEPVDQYLRTFQWNKVKYRADRSIGELIDLLHKVCIFIFSMYFKAVGVVC
jgi:hypothetical protein